MNDSAIVMVRRSDRARYIRVNKDLTYVITDKKTLIVTPLQVFRIEEKHKNWRPRLSRVMRKIESRRVTNIADLITELGPGIRLVKAKVEWYV